MVLFELSSTGGNGNRPDRLECEGLAIRKNGRVLIFGKSLRRRGLQEQVTYNPVFQPLRYAGLRSYVGRMKSEAVDHRAMLVILALHG